LSGQNGEGIPVVEHPENKLWIPDMIFGHLRSGSNFNDDDGSSDDLSGQNGFICIIIKAWVQ
jgi:DNA topoisomerase-2